MTVPGISLVPTQSVGGHTWYWAFTGLAARELAPHELDAVDTDYPLIIAARARKAAEGR
jgi:hypothetical protein